MKFDNILGTVGRTPIVRLAKSHRRTSICS
jgi:hypothetical protein